MKIHQLVHTLSYGDAISGEAIAIQRILRRRGFESNIYSIHSHEKVRQFVRAPEHFAADVQGDNSATVLLHYSIASPLNELFSTSAGIRRGVIYHNLTPPRWFANYNARVYRDLVKGTAELETISRQADVVIADSAFNRSELPKDIQQRTIELPLLLDREKWVVPANPGITQILRSSGQKNILHVGRLAPNKRVEDIIKAFYFYHHRIQKESKLWLIGIDIDTEIYSFELRRLVSQLRLTDAVQFVGSVADSELRSFYENCDLYLCMSEHEGFCLPLLEGMHFGIPVIAYASCAVPETVGNGAVLVSDKDPLVLAELMQLVLSDDSLRRDLIQRGKNRAAEFSTEQFETRLLSAIEQFQPRMTERERQHAAANRA